MFVHASIRQHDDFTRHTDSLALIGMPNRLMVLLTRPFRTGSLACCKPHGQKSADRGYPCDLSRPDD